MRNETNKNRHFRDDQNKSRIHAGNIDEIEMDGKDRNEFRTRDTNAYKQKYPSWKENLSYYFSQYCGATSIHGVQYVGERGRLIIEKYFLRRVFCFKYT